jgi:hypothetical protein
MSKSTAAIAILAILVLILGGALAWMILIPEDGDGPVCWTKTDAYESFGMGTQLWDPFNTTISLDREARVVISFLSSVAGPPAEWTNVTLSLNGIQFWQQQFGQGPTLANHTEVFSALPAGSYNVSITIYCSSAGDLTNTYLRICVIQ